MATGRVPTTANSPLTAKGDLFTYSTAPARLAVGNNGETIVADSSTSTGLRYIPYMSNNYAINGNFDIWQRGTSFSTQGVYTADRWYNTQSANITGSQQTSGAPDGSRYYFRQTATSTGGYYTMAQVVETANASQLWGKTVTFSVKLKRNATFDAGTTIQIAKNSAVDASPGTVWTEIAATNITAASISTSAWTTFSVTATIPNDGTANSIRIAHYYGTNPANGSILELSQFQFEIGSAVTPFRRSGGTIQGELAACQRYYYRWSSAVGSAYAYILPVFVYSATQIFGVFKMAQTMRTAPSAVETTGTASNYRATIGGTDRVMTSVPAFDQGNPDTVMVQFPFSTGGLTAGQAGTAGPNNTSSAYLGFSAEL